MSDHHAKPFDEATQTKLFIYKSYVQAWLQVFLHTRKFAGRTLRFFDFFSGPGVDRNGLKGSPMILLDEIAANRDLLEASGKSVEVYFNDSKRSKADALRRACGEYELPCSPRVDCKDFREAFEENVHLIGQGPSLVFLDQCGVKYVDRSTFEILANKPVTDILFFFASSFQRRFNEEFSNDLNVPMETPHSEVHRRVTEHYREWAPADYFLGDYSIKKGSNIYGLIFGSGSWYGMLKFLGIVWTDALGGDANFPMEAEKAQADLFEGIQYTKLELLEQDLRRRILSGELRTDGQVALHCITKGVYPTKIAPLVYGKLRAEGSLGGGRLRASEMAISEPRELVLRPPMRGGRSDSTQK